MFNLREPVAACRGGHQGAVAERWRRGQGWEDAKEGREANGNGSPQLSPALSAS